MKQEQEKKIINHGISLIKFFNLPDETDALNLCKKLRRIEKKTHILITDQCNEGIKEDDEKIEQELLNKVDKLLNFKKQDIKVFINGDCRGYALKISDKHKKRLDEFKVFMDWGGYGIIAPEIE